MKKAGCIILAAGQGTRMISGRPKVLHELGGKPMIHYALNIAKALKCAPILVVVGHMGDDVTAAISGARAVKQGKLLGSGHAVRQASKALKNFKGDILVLYGDTPLIKKDTAENLVRIHRANGAACTLLSAAKPNPTGYGRVVRDGNGRVAKIVEELDASIYEKAISEINVGAYCFDAERLSEALEELEISAKKREYYLTDVVRILRESGGLVEAYKSGDEDEALGVNSRADLAKAAEILRRRVLKRLMSEGVTVIDPATAYIQEGVEIGRDTVVRPCTVIESGVAIGKNCKIGPFSQIHAGTTIADDVEIGSFVEITRSAVAEGVRIKHHAYIGDTAIGRGVNVGAGTITANYDGKAKNRTVIKDGAFIGSGTILIAPVTVGKKAVTGAGCVVTAGTAVPDGSVVVGVPARILRKNSKFKAQNSKLRPLKRTLSTLSSSKNGGLK